MQIDWFTFIAQIVNFLILVLLLKRFLYKPVVEAMDRREQQISDRVEEARLKLTEANEKEAEYDKKLRDFDRHKEELEKKAKQETESRKQQLLKEARDEIDAQQRRWHESLAGEKESFLHELQVESGERILDIVRRVLTDLADRELEEQAARIFTEHLEEMKGEEYHELVTSATDHGGGTIRVISSYELDEGQKETITEILNRKGADQAECDFEVDPSLGFGIELRAGGWRAGWNLNGYIAKLRERMEEEFVRRAHANKTEPGNEIRADATPHPAPGPGTDNN